jgi:Cu/Ag efflux pump CusA
VYGYDLDRLAAKAADVRTMLSNVRGVVRPTVETQEVEPTVQVQVKLAAAQRYGITPGDVRRASATYFAGLPVGSLYEDQKIFDVVVWGTPDSRRRPTDVADLLIDTHKGGHVRLGDVADVKIEPAPTVIRHDNISRSLDVTAGVSGRSVNDVLTDVRARVADLPMPLEFHAEVLSDSEVYHSEHWRVAAVALAVAIAVLLLLHVALGSWRLSALLFVTFPLGIAGGVLAAGLVGGIGSLAAMMGILAVLGVVIRDGLVQLRNYQLADTGPRGRPSAEDVLAATRGQAPSIVLTALLIASAMVPAAVLGIAGGTEILQPLAIVVLGGLVSSTLFSTCVLPGLYLRFFSRTRGERPNTAENPTPAAV